MVCRIPLVTQQSTRAGERESAGEFLIVPEALGAFLRVAQTGIHNSLAQLKPNCSFPLLTGLCSV